ncbi:unnamed protein product [Closterium sp. NIES-54]
MPALVMSPRPVVCQHLSCHHALWYASTCHVTTPCVLAHRHQHADAEAHGPGLSRHLCHARFERAGVLSWKRHRLASQRMRAVMILKSWYSSHPGQRIGEGRRPRGVAPPEFAIEGEGLEEDEEEEEEERVEADAAGGEDAVVGSSSGAMA